MKDWRRSPEPAGMMGVKDAAYQVQGNWGQPDELPDDFDPAAPLPPTRRHEPATDAASRRLPSLYSMCLRVIMSNISSVQDLGDMPYRNAAPILEECRIDQLILLEEASPHLLGHTDEIWKRNCLRDFFELRKKYSEPIAGAAAPREPKSWRKLYFRTKGEIEQAKVEAAQRIKDKYAQHRAEKDAKKLVVSDRPLMAKTARSIRRFGTGPGAGGVTKGQSLLNKARSGSAAQAKLTAPRNGRPISGFKTQGRSRAVGIEIAPEAAGIETRTTTRPMVAPRKIDGGASDGLARLKQFSRPLPGTEAEEAKARSAVSRRPAPKPPADASAENLDTLAAHTGLPRLKPHQVAAAPPLAPSTSSPSRLGSASHTRNGTHTPGSASAASPRAELSPRPPPPDLARTERKKLDFFGTVRSSSPRDATVEVRGVKRARTSTTTQNSGSKERPPATSSAANGGSSPHRRVRKDDPDARRERIRQ